jgi:hypothetical protein
VSTTGQKNRLASVAEPAIHVTLLVRVASQMVVPAVKAVIECDANATAESLTEACKNRDVEPTRINRNSRKQRTTRTRIAFPFSEQDDLGATSQHPAVPRHGERQSLKGRIPPRKSQRQLEIKSFSQGLEINLLNIE